MPKILYKELWPKLVSEYLSGKSAIQISKEFGISHTTVYDAVHRMGLSTRKQSQTHHRKYSLDEEFFDVIDSEAKAYFLGLMFADGCNDADNRMISLWLKWPDKYILEEFRVQCKTSSPFRTRIINGNQQFCFMISNKHMSDRLSQLGCVPRKSLILKFPTEVPRDLMNHFIRGYFDGDGCISNKKCCQCMMVGTRDFLNGVKQELADANIDSNINPDGNIYRLRILGGRSAVANAGIWLYKDATIYFNRKYNIFEGIENKGGSKCLN